MQTLAPTRVNVLVFPCGSENAGEIYDALQYSLHVKLYGASSVDDHGRYRFKNYRSLPNIVDHDFTKAFSELISHYKINIVFATHDTVMAFLAPLQEAMGFYLVNGDAASAALVRKKSATYLLFSNEGWCPKVYFRPSEIVEWPVIFKPDEGQGGQGVVLVQNANDAVALSERADLIAVEYLPGAEITVDCFTDKSREVIWIGPRTRERIKSGISMRSQIVPLTAEIRDIAIDINRDVKMRGPWFFQLKEDKEGKWKLLEVCCRVAGTMVAQRAHGVNLPLMAVQDFLGRSLVTATNDSVTLIDRSIQTRAEIKYQYDTVFVDLDDTLIIDGAVVPSVIAFIYQSIADKKKIKLITRHAYDVWETLLRNKISSNLFDEIINVRDGAPKSKYINRRCIFIDNHFPERLEVKRELGIPVFDVDALQFFLR